MQRAQKKPTMAELVTPATTVDVAELTRRFAECKATIGVIGMGYVGFPLAIATHAKGYDVVAFDVDTAKVEKLNAGKSYLKGIRDEDVWAMVQAGRFHASLA